MKRKTVRILEFFIIGVIAGVLEDLIAIVFATDAVITPHVLLVVLLVALPFAFLSEVIVDHPRFWESFLKNRK